MHESWLPRGHPLHRPRHGGQQLVALVCAVIFFVSPLVAWGAGARATAFENKKLADFPSITQGWGFFTGLGQWATDNLVFRQGAVQAEGTVSRGVFNEEVPHDSGKSAAGPLQSTPTPVNGNPPWQSSYPQAFGGKDDWLYYGYDIAAKCQPTQSIDDTVTQLARLRQAVEASGRRFVLIVPPDKTTEVPEHLPDHYPGKDCHDRQTADFWRKIDAAGVIDLRKDLRDVAAFGQPIYHALDSHWTDEGAMVMNRDFAEAVQPGVSRTWTVSPDRTWTSQGDLPVLLGRSGETRGTYYHLRPDGTSDKTQVVSPDFRNPIHVTSPAPVTGMITDKVGLMGDSYTIPTSRYLAASFADLTIVHYATSDAHPEIVANALADRKVVALEAVERNLSGGFSGVLRPDAVDAISAVLAAHPMR